MGERVDSVNSSADRFVTCDDEQFQELTPAGYKVNKISVRVKLLLLYFSSHLVSCCFLLFI